MEKEKQGAQASRRDFLRLAGAAAPGAVAAMASAASAEATPAEAPAQSPGDALKNSAHVQAYYESLRF